MDWHDPTDDAQWVQEHEAGTAPSPFKPGNPPPFLDIPGLGDPQSMQLDYCHAFHLGYGIDAASSTVVLLANLGHFGRGALDDRLHRGYGTFLAWCRSNKKTTSIKDFSKQDFDMASQLPFSLIYFKVLGVHVGNFFVVSVSWWGFKIASLCCPGTTASLSLWEERPMTLPWFWRGWLLKCSKHRILSECGIFRPQHPFKLTSTV